MEVHKIKHLTLHEVFGEEDAKFTPWLYEHLDWLAAAVNIRMVPGGTEIKLANLRPDIIAYTDTDEGDEIIIENQYGKSDSLHLGKLLAYAAYEGKAKYAILITERAQEEHIAAINALNKAHTCDCTFFLVNVTCYKLGNDSAALGFEVVAGEKQGLDLSAKETTLQSFWQRFGSKAASMKGNPFYSKNNGSNTTNWQSAYIGITNAHFQAKITKNNASVYLLLDSNDERLNANRYSMLEANKEAVESAFGGVLEWNDIPEKKRCKVEFPINGNGGYDNEDKWDALIDKMLDVAKRMDSAFKPYYGQLKS